MTTTIRNTAKALVLLAAPLTQIGGGAAQAQDLSLPRTAERTYHQVMTPGAYALPTGVWTAETGLPTTRVEGRIELETWRIPDSGQSSFQLALPLRDALSAEGFEILLDCAALRCGSFDFRFNTLVLPAPEMFVSLDDYHFIAAQKPGAGAVSVLASQGPKDGYVQIIRAGDALRTEVSASAAPQLPATSGDLVETMETEGHVVLSDLTFESGSTSLGSAAIASLDQLAAYLATHADRRLMFVGHTDATGSLDANRAVSLKRAQAATAYLRERHGTPAGQLLAEGAGFTAPVASNLTEPGRTRNRRVEAVLLPAE